MWSLLMVAASALAGLIAGMAGTFLQLVVFDLDEQQLLSEAGPWGYVASLCLLAWMVVPPLVGIVLGTRARRMGEPRLGTTGIALNVLIGAYVVMSGIANLVLG